jgi:hypothetical protein
MRTPKAIILIFLLFSTIFFSYSIEQITLKLGEEDNRKVIIYNPAETFTDKLRLEIETTPNLNIEIKELSLQGTDPANWIFELAPKEEKVIPVGITPVMCTKSAGCVENATFRVVSLITGNSNQKTLTVFVNLEEQAKFVGAAPDFGLIPLLILFVAVILVKLFAPLKKSKK